MRLTRSAMVLAAFAPFSAAPAAAQDVQYETVTRVDFAGAMGTMMRVAARLGGGSTESVETTYIKGKRMRTDVDRTSTVFDMEANRFIHIDHDAKTYSVYTFEQMMQKVEQATQQMRNERSQQGAENAEAKIDFRYAVEAANQRERVAGYNAERFFLTMEAETEYTPADSAQREKGGTLVVLTDMWTSRDVPAYAALSSFRDASAQQYAQAGSVLMQTLAAAFADEPGMRVGFEQSVQEARRIEGMPLRSTVTFVTVAPNEKFDRELALGERRQQQQQGRGAALGRFAARAAGVPTPPQQEQEQPKQVNIVKVTTEVRNVSAKSLDAKLFEPPAGYREVAFDGV